jgi:hypothetical protein
MSDSAEDIVKRMQHVRRDVGEDVKGIVETAKTLTDWRYHVKHHPWACLGAALALGFAVAPRKRKIPSDDAKELIQGICGGGPPGRRLSARRRIRVAGK